MPARALHKSLVSVCDFRMQAVFLCPWLPRGTCVTIATHTRDKRARGNARKPALGNSTGVRAAQGQDRERNHAHCAWWRDTQMAGTQLTRGDVIRPKGATITGGNPRYGILALFNGLNLLKGMLFLDSRERIGLQLLAPYGLFVIQVVGGVRAVGNMKPLHIAEIL